MGGGKRRGKMVARGNSGSQTTLCRTLNSHLHSPCGPCSEAQSLPLADEDITISYDKLPPLQTSSSAHGPAWYREACCLPGSGDTCSCDQGTCWFPQNPAFFLQSLRRTFPSPCKSSQTAKDEEKGVVGDSSSCLFFASIFKRYQDGKTCL